MEMDEVRDEMLAGVLVRVLQMHKEAERTPHGGVVAHAGAWELSVRPSAIFTWTTVDVSLKGATPVASATVDHARQEVRMWSSAPIPADVHRLYAEIVNTVTRYSPVMRKVVLSA